MPAGQNSSKNIYALVPDWGGTPDTGMLLLRRWQGGIFTGLLGDKIFTTLFVVGMPLCG